MCQASLAFSVMVFGVKMATSTLPALEVVFFRSLLGSLMIGTLILRKKDSFLGKENKQLLLLRGVSGFLALTLHFYTISILPVGTAVILNYTGPIFVAILAALFLGERPGKFLAAMILLSFSGIYLLVRPEFRMDPSMSMAIFLALFSGFLSAIAVLSIRAVGFRESPLTIIFSFTSVSTIGSLFYLPFGFKWPNVWEWFAIALVAGGSFYGQLWMTLSYRKAPASLVSPFSYLTPLIAFLMGLLFWGELLTPRNIAGVVLVILGGTLISVVEGTRGRTAGASPIG